MRRGLLGVRELAPALQGAAEPVFRYLLLAAFLHGLALFWLPGKPRPAGDEPLPPRLELRLLPPDEPLALRPQPAGEPRPAGAPAQPPGRRQAPTAAFPEIEPAAPSSLPAKQAPMPAASAPETTAAPALPPAADLVAAARRQLREESRRGDASRFAAPPAATAEAPASPVAPLARAMAGSRPGEKMLAGGILRVTTAAGTVHCLQMPPRFAESSLTPAMAIPTTCP